MANDAAQMTETNPIPELVLEPQQHDLETWEIITEGTVWIWVYDKREQTFVKKRIGGQSGGTRKVYITSDDRRYNEDRIIAEMAEHNPFKNGSLRRIDDGQRGEDEDAKYHLTNEDLLQLFDLKEDGLFESETEAITSELILRRLKDLAEKHGTQAQLEFLRELMGQRYPVGGTQRAVKEMQEEAERMGGEKLSGF